MGGRQTDRQADSLIIIITLLAAPHTALFVAADSDTHARKAHDGLVSAAAATVQAAGRHTLLSNIVACYIGPGTSPLLLEGDGVTVDHRVESLQERMT